MLVRYINIIITKNPIDDGIIRYSGLMEQEENDVTEITVIDRGITIVLITFFMLVSL